MAGAYARWGGTRSSTNLRLLKSNGGPLGQAKRMWPVAKRCRLKAGKEQIAQDFWGLQPAWTAEHKLAAEYFWRIEARVLAVLGN